MQAVVSAAVLADLLDELKDTSSITISYGDQRQRTTDEVRLGHGARRDDRQNQLRAGA